MGSGRGAQWVPGPLPPRAVQNAGGRDRRGARAREVTAELDRVCPSALAWRVDREGSRGLWGGAATRWWTAGAVPTCDAVFLDASAVSGAAFPAPRSGTQVLCTLLLGGRET